MNIIIPAHSRLAELDRLLGSIARFLPDGYAGEIHVVIDGGDNSIQSTFTPGGPHGLSGIKVTRHDAALGLRENILYCGDLVERIGPAIILEDDLVAGPNFLTSAEALLDVAQARPDVAAASLYNFEASEFARAPVLVRPSGLAKMQTASSWGQIWWPEKWRDFRRWLAEDYAPQTAYNVPRAIVRWPERSWKKLFNFYLADTHQYSLVPPLSFVFNPGAPGANSAGHRNTAFSLIELGSPSYRDSPPSALLPTFDAYMEPLLETFLPGARIGGIDVAEIECNLYGLKDEAAIGRAYVLTFGAAADPVLAVDGRFGAPVLAALAEIEGKGLVLVKTEQFSPARNHDFIDNISKHHLSWLIDVDLVRLVLVRLKNAATYPFRKAK
jgi:hypothetical protein